MARRSKHRMKEDELVSGKELPKATSLREVRAQVDRPKEGLMWFCSAEEAVVLPV